MKIDMNLRLFFALLFFLSGIGFLYAQSPVTITGSGTCNAAAVTGSWTVPCGVTSITVEVYGGGGGAGGGGGGSNGGLFNTRGGGGAGGGGYTSATINVIPGAIFSYSAAAGGCGGSNGGDGSSGGNGTAGGNSTFSGTDAGGIPVNLLSNGGARGTGGSGTGGSAGSGGGGGSASGGSTNTTGTSGNNGSGGTAGAGGAGAGPAGGAGGASGANTGAAGAQYGGGGEGGRDGTGGRGAAGAVIITYTAAAGISAPTIASTPASCGSDGTSAISNYDNTLTYIFTPAGPTVGAGGAISGMIIGTSYTVEASSAGCTSSPSISFSNAPAETVPTVTAQATPSTSFCVGQTLNLAGTVASGTVNSWSWTGPDGFTSSMQNPSIPSLTPAATGTYTLTGTGNCGASAPATVNVTVNSPPTPAIAGSLSYCTGGNTTLTASGGVSYIWNNPANSTTASVIVTQGTYTVTVTDANTCTATTSVTVTEATSLGVTISGNLSYCAGGNTTLTVNGGINFLWSNNSPNQSITVSAPGPYSVTADDGAGCTGSASVTVTQTSNPVPNITGSLSYCVGSSTTLTASGGISYVWNDPSNSTTASITVTQGNYTVTATNTNGCTGTANAVVSENPAPIVTISGSLIYCENFNTTITASGGINYVWNDAGSSTNPSITVTQGNYTVTATDANGCTAMQSAVVTESPAITASISSPTAMCPGTTATLIASGGLNYVWDDGGTGAANTVSAGGVYSVTASSADGCSATASAIVTVYTVSPLRLGNDTTVCIGTSTTISAPGGYSNYLWSTSETTDVITVQTGGTYTLTVVDGNNCTASDAIEVITRAQPVVDLGEDRLVPEGTHLRLVPAISPNPGGFERYLWSPDSSLSCTTCHTPWTTVQNTTTYTLVYADDYGCTASDSFTINVAPPGTAYFPNAFSPNGDAVNDVFMPFVKNIKSITYSVYNRWGEKVFESNSELIGWDGRYQGVILPPGVYTYYAKIMFLDTKMKNYKGTVTLLR